MSEKSKDFLPEPSEAVAGIPTTEELYSFPSVSRLFAPAEPGRLDTIRSGYRRLQTDLDLVIRKGSNVEAAKAQKALDAINITLGFLDSLESKSKTNL